MMQELENQTQDQIAQIDQPVEQQPEQNLQQQTQETPKPEAPSESFKALRLKAARIEQERDEALRKLQHLEKQAQPPEPEEDDEIRLNPDDLAEGKHLAKVAKKIKKLEQQLQNYQQQSSEVTIEAKIRAQYPDFDQIVNKDTVDLLRNAYPELAQTINSSPDFYSKAVSAYTLIKKFGIVTDEPYSEEKNRAITNAAKPRPLASVSPQQGESPLTRANAFEHGLTEELKEQLCKEMFQHRKNF